MHLQGFFCIMILRIPQGGIVMAEKKHLKKSIIYKIVLTLLLVSIFIAALLFPEQEWIINTLYIISLIVLWFPRKSG